MDLYRFPCSFVTRALALALSFTRLDFRRLAVWVRVCAAARKTYGYFALQPLGKPTKYSNGSNDAMGNKALTVLVNHFFSLLLLLLLRSLSRFISICPFDLDECVRSSLWLSYARICVPRNAPSVSVKKIWRWLVCDSLSFGGRDEKIPVWLMVVDCTKKLEAAINKRTTKMGNGESYGREWNAHK